MQNHLEQREKRFIKRFKLFKVDEMLLYEASSNLEVIVIILLVRNNEKVIVSFLVSVELID